MYVSKGFFRKREVSRDNISSIKGKTLRINRSIQVEEDFGILKQDYGFRRFLMHGKKNELIKVLSKNL